MENYAKADKIILDDMRRSLDLSKPKNMKLFNRLQRRLNENNSLPRQSYLS